MGAICGAVSLRGRPLEPGLVDRMNGALAHHAVDGSRAWQTPEAGLGYLANRTTPEAHQEGICEAQRGADVTLVADMRLDNRAELGEALGLSAPALSRLSDAAVALEAYLAWGEAAFPRLLGDFTLAVWDGRNHRVVCARDPLGIRPLYYYRAGDFLVFATEIKGILQSERVTRRLNAARVFDYLCVKFEDQRSTFYEGVERLPAAHWLSFDQSGMRLERYWRLEPDRVLELGSKREYADTFRDLFVDSVRRRLRTSVPLGVLLSGGVDSSALLGVIRSLGEIPDDLLTLSARFPDYPRTDEGAYIDMNLEGTNLRSACVRVDQVGPLFDVDRNLAIHDEPFYAPNLYVDNLLLSAARAGGVRVLLDGIDGDTTVGHGWEHLGDLFAEWRWRRLARQLRQLSRRSDRSLAWLFANYALKPALARPFASLQSVVPRSGRSLPRIVHPELARRIDWRRRLDALDSGRRGPPRDYRQAHYRALTTGLLPFAFEVESKAAAAEGLVRRHPYFDRRLVEYCLSLPAEQRLDAGADRVVQRRGMDGLMPRSLQWRLGKSNWSDAFQRGLIERGSSRIEEALAIAPKVSEELVNIEVFGSSYARCRARKNGDDDFLYVWVATTLTLWLASSSLVRLAC